MVWYRRFGITLLAIALALLAVLAVMGGNNRAESQTAEKPNILFIMTDDMNKSDAQWVSNATSRIRDRGVNYVNFYIANPLCCPSRASIQRGQFSHNTLIWGNETPVGGYEKFHDLGEDSNTIATKMKSLGYSTAHVGKYMNNYDVVGNNCSVVPPGYDYWFAKCDDAGSQNGDYSDQGTYWTPTGSGFNEEAKFADEVNNFIDTKHSDGPMYIQYWVRAPHTGASRGSFAGTVNDTLPTGGSFNEDNVSDKPGWIQDNKRFCVGTTNTATCGDETQGYLQGDYRSRAESLKNFDANLNRVLNKLNNTGEMDNTYIVLTSDNGYLLGQHRHHKKRVPYEESSNVPLWVRGPDVANNVDRGHVVENVDFLQTFARLGGGTGYTFTDGRPFDKTWLPSTDTNYLSATSWPRDYGYVEGSDALPGDPPGYRMIYNDNTNSTYMRYPSTDENEYYDLDEDPLQLDNSASSNSTQVASLRTAASNMFSCAEDTCRMYDH